MKPFRAWPAPIRVCAIYLPVLAGLFAWYWVASDGGNIDSSVHRDALYVIDLVVFPIGGAAFLIHLFATLGTPRTMKWRLAIGALSGVAGIVYLIKVVEASSDGEAPMAYLGSIICFCLCATAGFAVSTVVFYVAWLFRKKQRA